MSFLHFGITADSLKLNPIPTQGSRGGARRNHLGGGQGSKKFRLHRGIQRVDIGFDDY